MTPSIVEFVAEYYDVVTISDGIALEECDTFCLIENHLDKVLQQCNGLFVDLFATKGSCLLVEGEDGLALSGCPKTERRMHYVDTRKVEQVIGWDMREFDRQVVAPKAVCEFALIVARKERAFMEVVDWEKEMLKEFQLMRSQNVFEEGEQGHYGIYEEEILRLAAIVQQQQEKISPWQEKLGQLVPNGDVNGEIQRIYEGGCLEAERLINVMTMTSSIQQERHAIQRLISDQYPNTKKYFPERTQAMVATLDKVREQFSVKGKVFLIAGGHHLKERERPLLEVWLEKKDSLKSLAPLYDWIKDKKVVILKPNWLSF